MTLLRDTAASRDPIDAAFLSRAARPLLEDMPPSAPREDGRPERPRTPLPAATPTPSSPIMAALLGLVPDQWARVADQIEMAHGRGCRVIAIAGGAKGEGRTTIVDGLEATLAARGRAVARASRAHILEAVGRGAETITLIDAGIWFPPGPIRQDRLSALAQGCHAAILVRRGHEAPCPARAAALTRIGIECLGEVETFVKP